MIITENEKSKVVFSSLFPIHYPKLYNELSDILWPYHKGYGTVSHTKDYWVRDFMPIQIDDRVFVRFVYNPDYLQSQRRFITDTDKVIKTWPASKEYTVLDLPLVADGGNMVFCKGKRHNAETEYVIMTEKVFVENPQLSHQQIELIIKIAFQNPELVIVWLPWDREDTFGHTDGIVRYAGVNGSGKPRVLVNLELYADEIAEKMYDALNRHFDVIELRLSEYEEMSWAYINSLQTQDFIILPGIGNAVTDQEALNQYRQVFPQYGNNIHQVQMSNFIKENGGALNCLTWTIFENYLEMLLKGAHIPLIRLNEDEEKERLSLQQDINDLLREIGIRNLKTTNS